MGNYCAKLRVMMIRLSHSMNYQGDTTFTLSDMSSARSVPRSVCYYMNNSARMKEMAEMIDGDTGKYEPPVVAPMQLSARKRSDSSGLRMANLLMTTN